VGGGVDGEEGGEDHVGVDGEERLNLCEGVGGGAEGAGDEAGLGVCHGGRTCGCVLRAGRRSWRGFIE